MLLEVLGDAPDDVDGELMADAIKNFRGEWEATRDIPDGEVFEVPLELAREMFEKGGVEAPWREDYEIECVSAGTRKGSGIIIDRITFRHRVHPMDEEKT